MTRMFKYSEDRLKNRNEAVMFFSALGYQVEEKNNTPMLVIKKNDSPKWICFYTTKRLMSACNRYQILKNYESLDIKSALPTN